MVPLFISCHVLSVGFEPLPPAQAAHICILGPNELLRGRCCFSQSGMDRSRCPVLVRGQAMGWSEKSTSAKLLLSSVGRCIVMTGWQKQVRGFGEMTEASCVLPSSRNKWLLFCQDRVLKNCFGGLRGNPFIPDESDPYHRCPFWASMHTHTYSMRLRRKLVFWKPQSRTPSLGFFLKIRIFLFSTLRRSCLCKCHYAVYPKQIRILTWNVWKTFHLQV